MPESRCLQGIWSSPWIFIFAASGSAVGLGNIWKFPYVLGENGGGAFLLVYCLCLLSVGLPVLIAEVALGRTVRSNPIDTVNDLSERRIVHPAWVLVPWLAGITGFLILTFYSVIAGWSIAYLDRAVTGEFDNITQAGASGMFNELLATPSEMLLWHSVFMALVVLTVGQSVTRGLSAVVRILLPMLVVTLLLMACYSMMIGNMSDALNFMFRWSWQDITFDVVLAAVGLALFSLSVGMGAMFAYGAYMSKRMSIARACSIVVGVDLLVALLAGLVIFPLVFSFDIDVQAGPSLTFVSLPIIFGNLLGGQFFAGVFFLLLVVAALTSAISMLELFVAWLHEKFYIARLKAALLMGMAVWFVGIAVLLSLNHWDSKLMFGLNLFELLDKFTSLILLPVGAILLSVLVAWFIPRPMLQNEMITKQANHFQWWYKTLKYISIPAMIVITLAGWIGV
ncbi:MULTISPECIES: sodium-dependent transporter [Marinomonas]|uniref:Transporter n=1 Tax=Marinomonas arctica TaxID=383750 RepID=A0A7H1J7Y9_9GAMM|nr:MULTISPECIES: sodium-dependent transporter [Marinomonas]MCS7486745.1 transporter [Marinomonas sp. BSi20414]QNT06605.1 sodium-dependent transporter [Marinomonas arctica]GGN22189.1 sodium-dependent transporter [Marinomonas arctica]